MILPARNIRWHWILLLFNLNWFSYMDAKEVRVVCYYTNWSVYRPGTAKFSPQNINPYLCTHLIYAFGGFTKDNILKPFDKYQDIEKGGYAKFTGLKTYNKQLKTLLAIGGWNEGSSKFSPLVASAERRRELVKNVVKFLRQNHFDGLDLDWEYPSFRDGGKPRDRDNYAQFVQELREEFERENEKTGRPRLLLTMAVPAGIEYINKGYDIPKLTKYLDWMNILSYDYHSAFEPSVNHHAPLYPLEADSEYNYDMELNIDYTIKHYLKLGADSRKLVLGIPTYGRTYTLFNPDSYDIGAPADGPGNMGDATRENGYLAYYEICENVKSKSWTVVQPNEDAMGPYAFKDNQWVGYDDENIARRKAEYVAKNNLGGIMFWAIDNDDFRGVCHDKPYPLIEASKEALVKAYGLGNQTSSIGHKTSLRSRSRGRPSTTTSVSTTESTYDDVERPSTRRRVSNKSANRKGSGSRRRRPSSTTTTEEALVIGSSLLVTTPSYKTPEPPTTPDPGGDFKCEEEGFFPHPRDCKKYFWCLAGPSELGIIAHQFTCPSGLYFNKAASSCDYTQNVLCNKKKTTTTTTTTPTSISASSSTEKTTTRTPIVSHFSTRRPPPKITAATSRTTFKATTTTEEPEYDDDYEEYENEEPESDKVDTEEDPQVIKELLNLIKKAGGIDELEKQLKLHEQDNSAPGENSEKSTKSTIRKKLYERVLKKTKSNEDRENNINNFRYNTINRNSRGPQNLGLTPEGRDEKTKYTSISRQRNGPQGVKYDEDEDNKAVSAKSQNIPEYVTIRRTRYSTTEANVIDEEGFKDAEDRQRFDSTTKYSSLQYSSIRRTRPTTKSNNDITQTIAEPPSSTSSAIASSSTAKPYIAIRRSRPTTDASASSSVSTRSSSIVENISTVKDGNSVVLGNSAIPVVEVVDKRTEEQVADNPTSGTNTLPISDESTVSDNKLTNTRLSTINTLNNHNSAEQRELTTTTTSPPVIVIPSKSFIQLAKPRPFSFTPRLLVRPSSKSTTTSSTTASSDAYPQATTTAIAAAAADKGEDVRPYRPDIAQEISDLSSLTALDLALGSGEVGSTHRGRRPTNPTASTRRRTTQLHVLLHTQPTKQFTNPPESLNITTQSTVPRRVIKVFRPHQLPRQRLPSNAFDSGTKLNHPAPFNLLQNSILYSTRNRFTSDEDQTEDENINLSETIRQESNDIGNSFGNTDEKGRRIIKRIRISTTPKSTTKEVNEEDHESEISTRQPLLFSSTIIDTSLRTRKIIRKLPTTTTTEVSPHELKAAHLGRTRKIIRRLSTTPSTISTENIPSSTIRSRLLTYSRIRPSTTSSSTTIAKEATHDLLPTTLNEEEDILTTTEYNLSQESSTKQIDDDSINTILDNSSTDNILSTKSLDDEQLSTLQIQTTTEESAISPSETTANNTTSNYIGNSVGNRIKSQLESTRNDGTVKIRPIKLAGGMRQNYFGNSNNSPLNSLEDKPEKTLTERPGTSYRRNRFKPKTVGGVSSTTEDGSDDSLIEKDDRSKNFGGTTAASYRRRPYKFRSSTSSTTTVEEVAVDSIKEEDEDKSISYTPRIKTTTTTDKSTIKIRFKPSFTSSTISTITETSDIIDLTNKRKQLFNRERVMNTPYFASTTSSTEASLTSEGTTEKPTTLLHVFAQTEPFETSTDSIDDLSTKKVERLIEISRIIDTGDLVINKIGEISRITSIKVVDNEINGRKFSEGPVYIPETAHNERQEKRYDGISKESNANTYNGNVITIDGKSSVTTITARPFSKNESSTIPLEGLFQTESPFRTETPPSAANNSPLVKIRLLEQDPFNNESEIDTQGKLVPVRVLSQDEATMRANVVEVKADNSAETIRIAPITFEKQIKATSDSEK